MNDSARFDAADEQTARTIEAELVRRQGPLVRRIERFFTENPNEWLTWADMMAKFFCTQKQARDAVNHLRNSGRVDFEVVGVLRVKE